MIICKECGNQEDFMKTFRRDITEEVEQIINGETGEGNGSENVIDTEESDDCDDEEIKCNECESYNIEQYCSKRDIMRIEWEHTDTDGEWQEVELDEEDRDPELAKELMVEKL